MERTANIRSDLLCMMKREEERVRERERKREANAIKAFKLSVPSPLGDDDSGSKASFYRATSGIELLAVKIGSLR